MGFFTDTTVCIGCKSCEVACKQWNDLPSDGSRPGGKRHSYDYTGALSASTWRHVRYVETVKTPQMPDLPATAGHFAEPAPGPKDEVGPSLLEIAEGRSASATLGGDGVEADGALLDRWVFMSDVCKHCSNAGCLDACPTGALIRTEFETVIVQSDVCNGCGYCVPSCPFGVVDRDHDDGRASKCTLCYDRLEDGLEPACAKACPTDSIQFGPYDELVAVASRRVARLHEKGMDGAYLYGAGDKEGEQIAGGLGAFFLFTEPPERYGLPAHADSPIQENVVPATAAAFGAGLAAAAGVALAFLAPEHGRDRGLLLAAVAGLSTVPDAVRSLRRRRTS
jgi:formate dehydrogenase iron-sulfur subunit